MSGNKQNTRNLAVAKFIAWVLVGLLFMMGNITPVGFALWIPAAVLAGILIAVGIRSPRYIFGFIVGIGVTLITLGAVNSDYVLMLLYGTFIVAGGIVSFTAFGPRTSKAEPPLPR